MSLLINNFDHRGINTDAKYCIRTSLESVIDLTRPEKTLHIEQKPRFKVVALSLVFLACLFSQTKTLLAESELEKDILTMQSGNIERTTADEEYTAPSHTDKLRDNFIDLANSLNEITSTTGSNDVDTTESDIAEEEYTEANLTDNTDNLRNSLMDLSKSLNEITAAPAPDNAGVKEAYIAEEKHTQARSADATSDTDNLRNNFIDLANSLNKITSSPIPPDELVAKEVPEKTIKTEITKVDNDVVQHSPVTVKLVAADEPNETLKPVVSSDKPIIVVAETKNLYNKYDTKGNLLDHESEQWACIHDTSNDLMWEVKSKDNTLRNSNNLYSWFDPKNKKLKGKPDGGRCEGGTECDTNAYVQAMNEKNFCGHNDWYLPTRGEMQTLVYLNNQNDPVKINKQYFPETVPSWYWTASENEESDDFAWYVLFRNGVALNDLKERPKHIRLVRNNNSQ